MQSGDDATQWYKIKKPFKLKRLEGLHPVFLTLCLLSALRRPQKKQQNAKAGLLAPLPF
jgi:hypothetical protein